MDTQRNARLLAILIFSLAGWLIFNRPTPAGAQGGACPQGMIEIGIPAGTYPGSTNLCAPPNGQTYVTTDDQFPCGQLVRSQQIIIPASYNMPLYAAPPSDHALENLVHVRFMFWLRGYTVFGYPHPNAESMPMNVRLWDQNGTLMANSTQTLANAQAVTTAWYTYAGIPTQYDIYFMSFIIDIANHSWPFTGGYLRILPDTASLTNPNMPTWHLTNLQINRFGDPMPDWCDIPNGTVPSTPAPPTPLPSPTGTWDPTPTTTPVAFPTAPYGTPVPTPVYEPIVFPQLPAEPTPTPWQIYAIPNVNWPTVPTPPAPVITVESGGGGGGGDPLPTIVSAEIDTAELDGLIDQIQGDWSSITGQVISGTNTAVTGTAGVSPPNQTVEALTSYITTPIAYFKAISIYLPHTGEYIVLIFAMTGMIIFVKTAQPLVRAAIFVFELLRRIWGLLPFT